MNTQPILRVFTAFAASLLFAGAVNAAGVSVGPAASIFLNQSDQPNLPGGVNYLQVDIWDGANGAIDFVVRPLQPLSGLVNGSSSTNYGIDSFAFNFGNSGATAANIVMTGKFWEVSNEKVFNGFGEFDAILVGDTQRKKTELQFSIVGVEGDIALDYLSTLSRGNAPNGNFLIGAGFARDAALDAPFASNVQLPGDVVTNRARFAGGSAAVPIPAAVWLLGSGLSFLAFFGRKNAKARA
jgi:hypothetical protein